MSTQPNPPADPLSVSQQRRQANILLMRLQWLLILLLIMAFAWLYISQQRFKITVTKQLQSHEQVVSRLNEMDDRLFAISQQTPPLPRAPMGNQAQNQLALLRIQMQAADRLLMDNDYSAAIDLLKALQWQLSQSNNEIAPALTIVIKQSLSEDIAGLQARSVQPNQWQLHNLAIQDIQAFLHRHDNQVSTSQSTTQSNQRHSQTHTIDYSAPLSRQQLTIHEVIMTLNLAIQASNMRKPDQLNHYLNQARRQLQAVADPTKTQRAGTTAISQKNKASDVDKDQPDIETLATIKAPMNITEVIAWLDQLIANRPSTTPLVTTQVLDQRQK